MPLIEIDHLRKSYQDQVAVDDVSFGVEEGEIFDVVGRNGAGGMALTEAKLLLREPAALIFPLVLPVALLLILGGTIPDFRPSRSSGASGSSTPSFPR